MAPSHLGASESQAPPPDADVHRGSLATPERLAAVRATGLLDDGGNPLLDRLARLAARLLSAPLARVSLVTDRAIASPARPSSTRVTLGPGMRRSRGRSVGTWSRPARRWRSRTCAGTR
jgi:hypothetical protein